MGLAQEYVFVALNGLKAGLANHGSFLLCVPSNGIDQLFRGFRALSVAQAGLRHVLANMVLEKLVHHSQDCTADTGNLV